MANLERAKALLKESGGIVKTSEFLSAGITKKELGAFCKAEKLVRVRQGYYQLAGDDAISEAQYLHTLLPEGIVCVESALFYYGYSDFAPRVWTLAVPRSISLPKLKINDIVPIKAYYIQNDLYEIGKTTAPFDGVELAIYDRDRTVCDCFKYRMKLDRETFSKAINAYAADDEKNLSNLSGYAKELGLYKRVMDLMEVVLNG